MNTFTGRCELLSGQRTLPFLISMDFVINPMLMQCLCSGSNLYGVYVCTVLYVHLRVYWCVGIGKTIIVRAVLHGREASPPTMNVDWCCPKTWLWREYLVMGQKRYGAENFVIKNFYRLPYIAMENKWGRMKRADRKWPMGEIRSAWKICSQYLKIKEQLRDQNVVGIIILKGIIGIKC